MDLKLACKCGKVNGVVHNVSPETGNRINCYCKDCQAFAHALDQGAITLNQFGGTDILQVPPSLIEITSGNEFISCLRLTDKGLYRWFASCCKTPIGNTGKAGRPFVGLIHTFIPGDQNVDAIVGTVQGSVFTKGATDSLPDEMKGPRSEFSMVVKMIGRLLSWKFTGKGMPNPFFDIDGEPVSKPQIVN